MGMSHEYGTAAVEGKHQAEVSLCRVLCESLCESVKKGEGRVFSNRRGKAFASVDECLTI